MQIMRIFCSFAIAFLWLFLSSSCVTTTETHSTEKTTTPYFRYGVSDYFRYGASGSQRKKLRLGFYANQNADLNKYFENVREKINLKWEYPAEASAKGIEGEVKLEFSLLQDGSVKDIYCSKTSGSFLLDENIAKAIVLASPFNPLPAGAKKEVVVTGLFKYVLNSNNGEPETSVRETEKPQPSLRKSFDREAK